MISQAAHVAAEGSVSSANNDSGLTTALETAGRPRITLYYSVGGDATIRLEYRNRYEDGSTGPWRTITTLDTSTSGIPNEDTVFEPFVAAYEVRATTSTTGIDVTFDVGATR